MLEISSSLRIVGLFSSWLANRNHHKTKLWEESRVKTYESVMDALDDLVKFHERCWDDMCHEQELTDDMREQRDKANTKLKKLANTGEVYFSDEANSALKEFLANGEVDYDHPFDIPDCILANISNAQNCLNKFKDELKIEPSVMDKVFLKLGRNRKNS